MGMAKTLSSDWTTFSPKIVLEHASRRGLELFVRDDRLVVRGPQSTPASLVQALLDRKTELMLYLVGADTDEREFFEERTAIAQFDGGLEREPAEKLAWRGLMECRGRHGKPK